MNITLSVDAEVVSRARLRAETLGTSVNQLIREYLEEFAGGMDAQEVADEFVRLSALTNGNSNGWKYNREDAYDRK